MLNVLLNGDQAAVVEIEYCLPDYSKCFPCFLSQNDWLTVARCHESFFNEAGKNCFKNMIIELGYSVSQNSLCVTSKLAQITVERENGCLGLTLRGGGEFPLIVTNIRPHGPVFKIGRIKPGDRLLRVDNVSLFNLLQKSIHRNHTFHSLRFRWSINRCWKHSKSSNAAMSAALPIWPLSTMFRWCKLLNFHWVHCWSKSSGQWTINSGSF